MANGFSEAFETTCNAHATKVAMVDLTGAPVSFSNLFYTVIAFAEALQDRGVAPGDLVSVHITDSIAGSALRLALVRIGATAIGAVPHVGSAVAVDWHLVTAGTEPLGPNDIAVGRDWIRSPRRAVPIQPGGAMVRMTSGTTGTPKLRRISDVGLLARAERGQELRGRPDGPVFIGYAPGSSPFFNYMARSILSGVLQIHPVADDTANLRAMAVHGVSTALLSPWNFRRLLAAVEAGAPAPGSLQQIMVGGGEVAPGFAARAEALLGAEVFLCYGSNETGSIAHARPAETPDLPGRVGAPYPDFEHRFTDEAGSPADPATGGELWLRVPEAIRVTDFPSGAPLTDAGGWVATGDICRRLPDGALQFIGRRSELLNIGGNKRAPQWFEALVQGQAGVADVAAFRLPDPGGGDRLGLAVVPAPGSDQAALTSWVAGQLGPRYPFQIIEIAAIPVTAAGKTDRASLSRYVQGLTDSLLEPALRKEEP
jgi:acyl-coenzyme A synthetase/AMP-(fatty) acid ligase